MGIEVDRGGGGGAIGGGDDMPWSEKDVVNPFNLSISHYLSFWVIIIRTLKEDYRH